MKSKTKVIELFINSFCNLDCSYCYLSREDRRRKDKFGKEQLDYIKSIVMDLELDEYVMVKISSGELTLFPEYIKSIYRLFKTIERVRDTHFGFGIYTNGTNIPILREFIDKYNFIETEISLSWDAYISNNVRGRSLPKETYKDMIRQVNQNNLNNICIRSALTKELLENDFSYLDFLLDNNCKNYEYYYIMDYDGYRDIEMQRNFTKFLDKLLEYENNGGRVFNFDYMRETLTSRKNTPLKIKGEFCGHDGDGCVTINTVTSSLGCSVNNHLGEGKDCTQYETCLSFRTCYNWQCVECLLSPHIRKSGDSLEYKLTQVCGMRDIERDFFFERMCK